MDIQTKFYEMIEKEMAVTLATSSNQRVTMRYISPVLYNESILLFTDANSLKYQQLKENPYCCIAYNTYFAEAKAEFLGATMLDSNAALREAYCKKFPGAFDEGVVQGGREADFILLKLLKLRGWEFDDSDSNQDDIPSIPFEIDM